MIEFSFLLVLLCEIINVNIVICNDIKQPEPPENITLRESNKLNRIETSVNLKKISNSFLANGNLPIWIVHAENPKKLEPALHVMNDIGPFFMYHDVKKCAAAIYFQKRQEFDGTISNHDIMYHVPYDTESGIIMPSKSNMLRSHMNHPIRKSVEELSNEISRVTGIYEGEEYEIQHNKFKFYPSLESYSDTVYIEILVIVNYDMAERFEYNYASLVSYVLVLFNSVDMLYSTIDEPKIKINIAGIIIGNEHGSFPKIIEYNCYQESDDMVGERLETICVGDVIKFTLKDYQETVPLDSYDVVVFLTDFGLHFHAMNEYEEMIAVPLAGYTHWPDENVYKGYKLSHDDLRVVIAYNFPDEFQSYSIIAHELAHAFNVLHDQGEFRDVDGKCDANLMRTDGSFCDKCLYFSNFSRRQLSQFFRSRDSCIFYNEPKSLHDPISGPRLFWNEDQQCKCYGYEYSYNTRQDTCIAGLFNKLWMTEVDCTQRLKCIRYENRKKFVDDTGYIMDGTPCKKKKEVCWDKKCEKIVD